MAEVRPEVLDQPSPLAGDRRQPGFGVDRDREPDGLEHGLMTARTHAGALIEERTYQAGMKHGVHRGWFAGGGDRFYTEFADDHYAGEHWTWHANGKVAEYKKYTADGKILVHKHWRESGQIYRNQVFAENFELGMPGVKLCNTVKDTVSGR